MAPAPNLVARFAADLDGLITPGERLGVAVSGGPDSLALLLLAQAARPAQLLAATVDHGLRPDSAAEAAAVADLCRTIGVPHSILTLNWPKLPASNLQAAGREQRYAVLGSWAAANGVGAVATGHHLDDQAETVLMRLARGAGVGGLMGIQQSRPIHSSQPNVQLVRPLLSWRRAELAEIVAAAGLEPACDPSNTDQRFDRTQARALLAEMDWLDPPRLAAVANHARDAEESLAFAVTGLLAHRIVRAGSSLTVQAADLPHELQRRLLLSAMAQLSETVPPGPQLCSALDRLREGATTTLAGLKLTGGDAWRIEQAPPRRTPQTK